MDKTQSRQCLDVGPLAIPASKEHVALLEDPGKFERVQRKDDLLDEGVAAVFGLAGAKAELLALCFEVGKFTHAEAVRWLAERGFEPLSCISNTDG